MSLLVGLAVVLLLWALYRQVAGHDNAQEVWEGLRQGSFRPVWPWLFACLFLMPLNWYLEVLKWRNFFNGPEVPSMGESARAVLGGISLSFLTPNRSGEYAARVVISRPDGRWAAVYAALGAAYCQWVALLAMGLPAVLIFLSWLNGASPVRAKEILIPGAIVFILLLAAGLFIRKLLRIVQYTGLSRRLGRWWDRIEPVGGFSPAQIGRGTALAALRYGVYSLQYFAMLRFSGIVLPPEAAYAGVGTIYLIQTGLPLPPALGFLARGEIALLVWQTWEAGSLQVLTATYGLFVINLGLPALLGVVMAAQFRRNAQKDFVL